MGRVASDQLPVTVAPKSGTAPSARLRSVVLAAAAEAALVETVRRFREDAGGIGDALRFDEFCAAATVRSGRYPHRFAAVAATRAELLHRLDAFALGATTTGTAVARRVRQGRIAFVFSGSGGQWKGMATDLMADPGFRKAMDEVDALLAPRLRWSVVDALREADAARLARTDTAQPLLFAVQVGLAALLAGRGIRPEATFGHGAGEVAAAYVAGALDLETAARVIAERSRALARLPRQGRMAVVGLSERETVAAIASYSGMIEIAATDSRAETVVAGETAAIERLVGMLATAGIAATLLDRDQAFHSSKMSPVETELIEALDGVVSGAGTCLLFSTVTGLEVGPGELDSYYWWRNVRAPVRFAAAVENLIARDFGLFVEIGPDAVLAPSLRRFSDAGQIAVVPTLTRFSNGPAAIDTMTARLLASGADIDWMNLDRPASPKRA